MASLGGGDEEVLPPEPSAMPHPPELFHLELHAWMDAQQTLHGVRHDDYSQYHAYCTRRLHRLSHLVDAKKYLVCSSKYASSSSTTAATTTSTKAPKRHMYCSRLEDTFSSDVIAVPHVNILWYLLVLSERAWAQSKELAKQGKRRQQVLAKLKRAVKWASLLVLKAQLACDPSTVDECRAYEAWIKANYALEQGNYRLACQEYANAMTLCYKLSQPQQPQDGDSTTTVVAAADETLRLERQDLFVTRADTVLRPLFRYCQYELKQQQQQQHQAGQDDNNEEEATIQEPRLAHILHPTPTTAASSSNGDDSNLKCSFRGIELVLDVKELRVLLLKLDSTASEQQQQQQETEESFLNALSILDDALEVVARQLATLNKKTQQTGPAVQAKVRQYLLWKGYLQHQKTLRVMDHTSRLLETVTTHAERVHIYDALLQHAKTLLHLPRPSDSAEEEDEFALQAQANVIRLRALKTFYMAWYYLPTQNVKAAWALVEHSSQLCNRAQEEIAACDQDMLHAEEYLEELEGLPYDSLRAAIRAASYLQTGSGSGASRSKGATQRPLLLRLEEEDPGMVLAGELAPIPLPCKPVFYDLALNDTLDTANSLDLLQQYVDKHTVLDEPDATNTKTRKGFLGSLFG